MKNIIYRKFTWALLGAVVCIFCSCTGAKSAKKSSSNTTSTVPVATANTTPANSATPVTTADPQGTAVGQQDTTTPETTDPQAKTDPADTANSGNAVSEELPAGTGIGTLPDLGKAKIGGKTIKECNDTGKVWAPQLVDKTMSGSCVEDLAKVGCDAAHLEAYFKGLDLESSYKSFVSDYAGYTLYNCGLKDEMLVTHWLQIDGTTPRYASLTVTFR